MGTFIFVIGFAGAVVALSVMWFRLSQREAAEERYWQRQRQEDERRVYEQQQEQIEQQQKQIAVKGQQILDRQRDVVKKFLEIAERKVSVLDDYGDERMHLLPKEVDECIAKLGIREGNPVAKFYAKMEPVPLEHAPWRWVALRLPQLFTEYHELQKSKARTREEINSLSGTEFESHVARMLQRCGWQVSGTPTTGDQGADLIVSKEDRRIAIQIKRYASNVGNSAVQEVIGAVRFYGANEGCVVTNSSFTSSARSLAQKNNIRLIEGSNLDQLEAL